MSTRHPWDATAKATDATTREWVKKLNVVPQMLKWRAEPQRRGLFQHYRPTCDIDNPPNIFRRTGLGRLPDVEFGPLHYRVLISGADMRRRQFVAGLGGAAAWPVVAIAQRSMMSIGFLGVGTLEEARRNFEAVLPGLAEFGYVESRNLEVQFRCADYHNERLPSLATELVQSQVAAIIAGSGPSASAAIAATGSIPIIFLLALIQLKVASFQVSIDRVATSQAFYDVPRCVVSQSILRYWALGALQSFSAAS